MSHKINNTSQEALAGHTWPQLFKKKKDNTQFLSLNHRMGPLYWVMWAGKKQLRGLRRLKMSNLERNIAESSVEPSKKESMELSESQIYSNSEIFFFFNFCLFSKFVILPLISCSPGVMNSGKTNHKTKKCLCTWKEPSQLGAGRCGLLLPSRPGLRMKVCE